jgi:hypothetical protein
MSGFSEMFPTEGKMRASRDRKWLKEATMSRLTDKLLNRSEMSTLSTGKGFDNVSVDKLDSSGLTAEEKSLLCDWISGRVSGRHCLCLLASVRAETASKKNSKFIIGSSKSLLPLLASIVSFPTSMIEEKTNILLDQIFSKPPLVAVGETLKRISKISKEKSMKTLRAEQINLAFKQMRLEQIKQPESTSAGRDKTLYDDVGEDTGIAEDGLRASEKSDSTKQRHKYTTDESELYCLQVKEELVQLFFEGKFKAYEAPVETIAVTSDYADAKEIIREMAIPVENLLEESKEMTHLELDAINSPIKSYINQLSSFKISISSLLKDIEESGAYLSLGISKEASDAEIKKAYHGLAIKIHPDKPGGDTEKFQALQASYQEIVAARRGANSTSDLSDKKHLEGIERALSIEKEMTTLLASCKAAAEQVATQTQIALQLLKMCEKHSKKLLFPDLARTLYGLLLGKEDSSLTNTPINVLLNTVEPTETVAKCMQNLANKAIGLSACGSCFALAIASSPNFGKAVEETMSSSLDVYKTLSVMMGIECHASECIEKLKSSKSYIIYDIGIHDVIVEMVMTVVASCASSLKATADKVVAAAIQASELQLVVGKMITSAQEEAAATTKREAEFKERRAEAEMMGDLEGFMEAHNYQQRSCSSNGEKDDSTEKGKEDEDISSVDGLTKKLKSLQLQIRVQNAKVLQKMTNEINSAQKKMHMEVQKMKGLPSFSVSCAQPENCSDASFHKAKIISLLADLIDHSCVALRERCRIGNIPSAEVWSESLQSSFSWVLQLGIPKLALWPDLRTRALWLAALVDYDAVRSIFQHELSTRLIECLQCPNMRYAHDEILSGPIVGVVKVEFVGNIESFCKSLESCIDSISKSLVDSDEKQNCNDDKKMTPDDAPLSDEPDRAYEEDAAIKKGDAIGDFDIS